MSATLPFTVTSPLTSKLTSQGPPSQCVAPHPPCFLIRHLPYSPVRLIKPYPFGFPSWTCSVLCISTALSQVTLSYLECCHAFCLVRLSQPCPNQPILSINSQSDFSCWQTWPCHSWTKFHRFLRLQVPTSSFVFTPHPVPPAMTQYPL